MATLTRLTEIDTSEVKLIGPRRARDLEEAGIRHVADLLHHVPRRYIDRSLRTPISKTPLGSEVTVIGEVSGVKSRRPRRNLQIIEAFISDDTARIKAVWFNQSFRINQLTDGTQVAASGVVESYRGSLQMRSPEIDVLSSPAESLSTGRVVPIHPSVAKLSPGVLRRSLHNALQRARPIEDPLPSDLLEARFLIPRDQAFADIHFPESLEDVARARRRLVYDELFRLELALALQKRRQMQDATGIAHEPTGLLTKRFFNGLPYQLTDAQRRVLSEIGEDLAGKHPMHRLLQGEVGSGKTVVAVAALLAAVEGGWQGAVMAPTEVLAEQHFLAVSILLSDAEMSPDLLAIGSELGMESLFGGQGPAVHLALLTGSKAKANYNPEITRQELLTDVLAGQVDVLVGTHALIQEGVEFGRLGLAVIDEQHRFGVAQRVKLKEKATEVDPDLLIMTATPIPRTLSMTLYGDLDVSTIDQMPPGRNPVDTRVLTMADQQVAWDMVQTQVMEGRQAFVVCPLVEDSAKVEAASATAEHQRLSSLMPHLRVGLIHGQLKSEEKEQVMGRFRAAEIDVLVSTTVIEVGIDVPNATVMVIEDADRFGLSQLHQLRGRVGRGEHPGVCVLLADPSTPEGTERIDAMVATNDGFRLAEEDLRIRGQGTVFDNRQSGMTDLRLANILEDFDVLVEARRDAFAMVAADPRLSDHPQLREEVRAMLGEQVEWLFRS